ncbi:type II toxin-antitoxin system HipA family toxin YjjJ [Luteibacter sp. E-22]|uniref:type II toxin-antitoxin system HipA family toxin YjjJ n=1 Tax=Luteibacter sp. E-22 TaxID=3404050 RepID=UPI003CEEF032
MNVNSQTSRLIDALRQRGPASARDLGEALGASQPTVSRLLTEAGGHIARIGRARRTRYAALRDVRGLGTQWPLFRLDTRGQPVAFGHLSALYGAGSLVTVAHPVDWLRDEFADGLFPGVPWFLDDQRPQGFLGRQFAQRWSRELDLPPDILRWNDDAVLAALLLRGGDGPGDFILGDAALERALQWEPQPITSASRHVHYAELARAALAGEAAGSPAAGEQPKFTATVEDEDGTVRHVIVKFSEPVDDHPAARRWADLLICEHIAGELLAEHGNPSARTDLVWSQGRMCLEVTRFDRVGVYGRRGCVTLAAWSDAHDGERDDWPRATARMVQGGWLGESALDLVRQRWWFGRLIGNTDMHFGNLSFFVDGELPFHLTPNYDMLPMLYRPGTSGALLPRDYKPAVPTPADAHYWQMAAEWAELYWRRVAAHAEISGGFRDLAQANHAVVSRLRQRFTP